MRPRGEVCRGEVTQESSGTMNARQRSRRIMASPRRGESRRGKVAPRVGASPVFGAAGVGGHVGPLPGRRYGGMGSRARSEDDDATEFEGCPPRGPGRLAVPGGGLVGVRSQRRGPLAAAEGSRGGVGGGILARSVSRAGPSSKAPNSITGARWTLRGPSTSAISGRFAPAWRSRTSTSSSGASIWRKPSTSRWSASSAPPTATPTRPSPTA